MPRTEYHVSKHASASNSNGGTNATTDAWATIAYGLNTMAGGDTLTVYSGTYDETITHNDIKNGSTASYTDATILQANTGDTVTIQPTSPGDISSIFWIGSINYVIIDGFVLDAVNLNEVISIIPTSAGDKSAHHIRIQNNIIKNAKTFNGIGFSETQSGTDNIEILNNTIHDNGADILDHQIYYTGTNHLIEGNTCYNSVGYGIHGWHPTTRCDGVIIRGNTCYNNARYGILVGSSDDTLVYNNVVYGNGTEGATYGGIRVSSHSPTNTQIYNNTIFNNAGPAIKVNDECDLTTIKNNIMYNNGTDGVEVGSSTNNTISDNFTTDPKFTAPLSDPPNFHLQVTSLCINTGADLSGIFTDDFDGVARPQGVAWDIGAFEYGQEVGDSFPVANDDVAATFVNEAVLIDVVANDTD